MSIRESIVLRVWTSYILVGCLALALLGRIFVLQWVQREYWTEKATGIQKRSVDATRGNIFSDDGSILAASLPVYKIAFDPTISSDSIFNSQIDTLAFLLADLFQEKNAEEYAKEFRLARSKKWQYIPLVKRRISHAEKKKVATFPILAEGRAKGGFIFEKFEERYRPFPDLARRTVGIIEDTTENQIGRGLEYSFNEYLGGVDGEALYQRMPGGNWIPMEDVSQVKSIDGYDITSTLDINIQDTAHYILEKYLKKYKADYGALILMEVKTGEIKAMVNLGKDTQGGYFENNNYAVGSIGMAEPGSTFKLLSLMAVFETAQVALTDTVDTGNGTYEYFTDAVMSDIGSYGKISVQEVFEKSSNIGVSKLVWKYFRKEPEKYIDFIRKSKLTEPLGFQMKGEGIPYIKIPSDSSWSGSTLPWMSIGYELKLSPLHILTLYNAVANQGVMIKPIIVKNVLKGDKIIKKFEAEVINPKICSDETLVKLRNMLEGVVEHGTAKNIKNNLYGIAGKTGTAEIVKDGKYTEDHYTSFVGYFPSDEPKYSCIVVIDNPKDPNDRYGAQVSGPVFKELADVVFHRKVHTPIAKMDPVAQLNLPWIRAGKRNEIELLQRKFGLKSESYSTEDWVQTSAKGDTILWKGLFFEEGKVPNVDGMTLRDALPLLEQAGLKVKYSGVGRVMYQSLAAGTKIKQGSVITLKLQQE